MLTVKEFEKFEDTEIVNIDEHWKQVKLNILSNFDIAIKIDFLNAHHKKIFRYLNSLSMYMWAKLHGSIGGEGSYLMFSFNERNNVENKIEVLKTLVRNENREGFKEYMCGKCVVLEF